jgi:ABC-type cobalamin/Fe3+-siderophores transport system ATPase subunit
MIHIHKLRQEFEKFKNKGIILQEINGNDSNFRTSYTVYYVDLNNLEKMIGKVKIGKKGMKSNGMYFRQYFDKGSTYNIDFDKSDIFLALKSDIFEPLNDNYFSLGDEMYYKFLATLPEQERNEVLITLRDVVYNQSILSDIQNERVFRGSLLKDVSLSTVKGRYRRILNGELFDGYKFTVENPGFITPDRSGSIDFEVNPDSKLSTNLHAFIGSNGCGKTTLLKYIADHIMSKTNIVKFSDESEEFAGIVYISFSAFDNDIQIPEDTKGMRSKIVDLKGDIETSSFKFGTPSELSENLITATTNISEKFCSELLYCCYGNNSDSFVEAINFLKNDKNLNYFIVYLIPKIQEMSNYDINEEKQRVAREDRMNNEYLLAEIFDEFEKLSSGHKIVLLALVNLINYVEEKTIVLLDEPELHLHPPLLCAYLNAVSYILEQNHGMAIISTHSPMVLQEISKSCIWVVERLEQNEDDENCWSFKRPEKETFGENVGVLTGSVFGLEFRESSFYKMIQDAVKDNRDYESALKSLGGSLGLEGKMFLQSAIQNKE